MSDVKITLSVLEVYKGGNSGPKRITNNWQLPIPRVGEQVRAGADILIIVGKVEWIVDRNSDGEIIDVEVILVDEEALPKDNEN
jgi:hypothetical protein